MPWFAHSAEGNTFTYPQPELGPQHPSSADPSPLNPNPNLDLLHADLNPPNPNPSLDLLHLGEADVDARAGREANHHGGRDELHELAEAEGPHDDQHDLEGLGLG